MINYLIESGFDVESVLKLKEQEVILFNIPFNSNRKRQTTAILDRRANQVKVFVKGAPEIVIQRCTSYIAKSGDRLPLDEAKKIKITNTEICKEFSRQSYRTLLVAYASFEIKEWDQMRQ